MTTYTSVLTGIHPLSEPLIKQIFDLKYGRVSTPDLVRKAFKQDILDIIAVVEQAYPAAVSTGNLGWWDIYRPFTEALLKQANGDNTGNLPVVRMPLTNTFYRQPIVNVKFTHDTSILKTAKHPFLDGNILQHELLPDALKEKAWSVCLPGPYTFSRAAAVDSQDTTLYRSKNELMDDFTEILREEIKYLASEGFSHMVLDEGGLAWEPLNRDTATAVGDLWNRINEGASLKVAIHTYHALEPHVLELLANANVWAVGIDCVRNTVKAIREYDFDRKTLIAGVVDAQSYFRSPTGDLLVEETHELVNLGEKLVQTEVDQIVLAPTSRLEFIPRSVADLKVRALGETIKALEEHE